MSWTVFRTIASLNLWLEDLGSLTGGLGTMHDRSEQELQVALAIPREAMLGNHWTATGGNKPGRSHFVWCFFGFSWQLFSENLEFSFCPPPPLPLALSSPSLHGRTRVLEICAHAVPCHWLGGASPTRPGCFCRDYPIENTRGRCMYIQSA